MKLESRYSIGDVVFHPRIRSSTKQEPCPDCLGTKLWLAQLPCGEEVPIQCPTCTYGYECRGTIAVCDPYGKVERLTIGSVRLDTAGEGVQYMCRETGIGTGNIWDESVLHPTQKEAEALLPVLVEEHRIMLTESRAASCSKKRHDGPGRMVAYYREQIRRARLDIGKAQEGLVREGQK